MPKLWLVRKYFSAFPDCVESSANPTSTIVYFASSCYQKISVFHFLMCMEFDIIIFFETKFQVFMKRTQFETFLNINLGWDWLRAQL